MSGDMGAIRSGPRDRTGHSRREILLVCIPVVLGAVCLASAGEFQTSFTAVSISDVPVGYSVPLVLTNGARYSVENPGDRPLEIGLAVVQPKEIGQGADYAPIPDISWVTLATNRLTVPARGKAEMDIWLSVPGKAEFANRKYEFRIRAFTLGRALGIALVTRVRFNTVSRTVSSGAVAPEAPPQSAASETGPPGPR